MEKDNKEDDRILKQLKSTQASMVVWELFMSFKNHCSALIKALNVLNVSTNATPKEVAKFLLMQDQDQIVFDSFDLHTEGRTRIDHCSSLLRLEVRRCLELLLTMDQSSTFAR